MATAVLRSGFVRQSPLAVDLALVRVDFAALQARRGQTLSEEAVPDAKILGSSSRADYVRPTALVQPSRRVWFKTCKPERFCRRDSLPYADPSRPLMRAGRCQSAGS